MEIQLLPQKRKITKLILLHPSLLRTSAPPAPPPPSAAKQKGTAGRSEGDGCTPACFSPSPFCREPKEKGGLRRGAKGQDSREDTPTILNIYLILKLGMFLGEILL